MSSSDDDLESKIGCLFLVVVLIFCGAVKVSRDKGIHTGIVVEHGHANPSGMASFHQAEQWWLVIASDSGRNTFPMDRYDWESVKVGDRVEFSHDKFIGVIRDQ